MVMLAMVVAGVDGGCSGGDSGGLGCGDSGVCGVGDGLHSQINLELTCVKQRTVKVIKCDEGLRTKVIKCGAIGRTTDPARNSV